MMLARPIVLLACALSLAARGQSAGSIAPPPDSTRPDEGWAGFPGQTERPLPPPPAPGVPGEEDRTEEPPSRAPLPPPSPPSGELEVKKAPPPPPLRPNEVSLYAANALGKGHGAAALSLGYPFLQARAAYGVLPRVDAGLSFQTLYGAVTDLRALVRWEVLDGEGWHLGLLVDGGYAFFIQPAVDERQGARWLTGLRNWNLAPGVAVSYQGAGPRAPRLFAEARYHLAFDTEPFQRSPLGGVPAGVQVIPNLPLRLGAELPWSAQTSLLLTFGLDFHGGPDDAAVMPVVAMGLVTTL